MYIVLVLDSCCLIIIVILVLAQSNIHFLVSKFQDLSGCNVQGLEFRTSGRFLHIQCFLDQGLAFLLLLCSKMMIQYCIEVEKETQIYLQTKFYSLSQWMPLFQFEYWWKCYKNYRIQYKLIKYNAREVERKRGDFGKPQVDLEEELFCACILDWFQLILIFLSSLYIITNQASKFIIEEYRLQINNSHKQIIKILKQKFINLHSQHNKSVITKFIIVFFGLFYNSPNILQQNNNILIQMIIKNQGNKASGLKLKFLDLKFVAIQDHNKTIHQFNLNKSYDSTFAHDCNLSSQKPDKGKEFISWYGENPKRKGFSKCQESTNDLTHNSMSIATKQNQGDSTNLSHIISFINEDAESIYKQIGKKNSEQAPKQLKQQSRSTKAIGVLQKQIRNYSKQNQEIHKQIAKIYLNKQKMQRPQKKNITNIKLYEQQSQFSKVQNLLHDRFQPDNADGIFKFKFESKKKKLLGSRSNSFIHSFNDLKKYRFQKKQKIINRLQKQYQQDNKQKKLTLFKFRDTTRKNNTLHLQLPNLSKNRYEQFYEDLYKEEKTNLERSKQKKDKNKNEGKQQGLEELKKRMINNNLDKNFQTFFLQKNIRVPELLKNLR